MVLGGDGCMDELEEGPMILLLMNMTALLVFAGAAKAKADRVAHLKDARDDWKNKWAHLGDVDRRKRSAWYLGLYAPNYLERFPYSSTVLVWLTDRWHWYNFIQYRCVDMAIALAVVEMMGVRGWWVLLVAPVLRGLGFSLFYDR